MYIIIDSMEGNPTLSEWSKRYCLLVWLLISFNTKGKYLVKFPTATAPRAYEAAVFMSSLADENAFKITATIHNNSNH